MTHRRNSPGLLKVCHLICDNMSLTVSVCESVLFRVSLYDVFKKKLNPFYFCNNFVDPGPIWIIFGRYIANEFSSGLQGLGYHAGLSVSDTDS